MEAIRSLREGKEDAITAAEIEQDVRARLDTAARLVDWLTGENAAAATPFLRLDKGWWYAAIPLCGAAMALYSLAWLWRVIRGEAALESTATLIG